MKKNQHVVPSGNQWAVRGEGNSKKTKITHTQRDAIEIAPGDCPESAIGVSNSSKEWSNPRQRQLWE